MRSIFVCLLFCPACEAHTVAVFAPAADVAPRTVIAASIQPGKVTQYPAGTRLVDARLKPTDTVVVEAESGDDVGKLHVRRRDGYDGLQALGYLFAIGGPLGSVVFALSGIAGILLWPIPAAGSLLIGCTLIAVGRHGELVIEPQKTPFPPARAALPFIVRF